MSWRLDAFRFINDVITQKGGGGGSQKVTNDDEGGGEGVSIPPKNDDVIYEQPLTQYCLLSIGQPPYKNNG